MASLMVVPVLRGVLALLAVASVAGCATRYDSMGNSVFFWQHGQGSETVIDYSNPRLPVLPRSRPPEPLWQIPSPYEFNDLSRYSLLAPPAERSPARVGDNAGCAAPCNSPASGALVVARADDLAIGRSPTGR